jgi:hypothetical protein
MPEVEQEPITITGAPRNPYRQIKARYDYTNAPTRCPNCGHDAAGAPWHGWFSCWDYCFCISVVETGEAFVPMEEARHGDVS